MIMAFNIGYVIPLILQSLPSTSEIWMSFYRAFYRADESSTSTSKILNYKVVEKSLSSVAQSAAKVGASATSQPGNGRDDSPTSNEKAAAASRMNSDKALVARSSEEENTEEDRNENEDDHEETEEEKKKAREEAEYIAMLNRSAAGRQSDISNPFKVPETHLHILRECEKMPGDVHVGDFGCVAMTRVDESVPGRERRKAREALESCARFVLPSEVDENLLIHAEPAERRQAARKRTESGGQASLSATGGSEHASSVSGLAREERQNKNSRSKGDENKGVGELKLRSTGRSAAVADANEGRLKVKEGDKRTIGKGPYFGAKGWRIELLAHAIHYLNSPATKWDFEKAYVFNESLGAHIEIHKLRGRKDQAAARSRLVQARRAEAAEAKVAVVQKEVTKLRKVAEGVREEAKVELDKLRKEAVARSKHHEREMQGLKQQFEEMKASFFEAKKDK